MNRRIAIIIVMLILALGWLCLCAQSNPLGDRLSPPQAPAKVTKQAAQLIARAPASVSNSQLPIANSQMGMAAPANETIIASMDATNELQFCADLSSNAWTTVAVFQWPEFQTNVPAPGPAGFYRLKTSWAGGCLIVTNQTAP